MQFLVRWSPQRTLVPSFFFFFYLSSPFFQIFPFTCNFMWFIKLRASAGISGYVWGVCMCPWVCVGVRGCAQVCTGVHGCVQVCASVRVCAGVDGYVWVCAGVRRCVRVCTGVCVDMHGYTHVCGMNFQNFFWRIESLHQRTLIRILYEFFYKPPPNLQF